MLKFDFVFRSMNGVMEFVDTQDMTVMSQTEHFMATDVEWDPTGRYVVSAVSWWGHKVGRRPFCLGTSCLLLHYYFYFLIYILHTASSYVLILSSHFSGSIKISHFLSCFCSFDRILEKGNFIKILYIVLS